MQYSELEDNLIYYNKAAIDYAKVSNGRSEYEQEQAGFISGELHETHEILLYSLTDSRENFEAVSRFLEEHCPNAFSIMTDNLEHNPTKYNTLYDLCREIDIRRTDGFEFPIECLKKIKIYL